VTTSRTTLLAASGGVHFHWNAQPHRGPLWQIVVVAIAIAIAHGAWSNCRPQSVGAPYLDALAFRSRCRDAIADACRLQPQNTICEHSSLASSNTLFVSLSSVCRPCDTCWGRLIGPSRRLSLTLVAVPAGGRSLSKCS